MDASSVSGSADGESCRRLGMDMVKGRSSCEVQLRALATGSADTPLFQTKTAGPHSMVARSTNAKIREELVIMELVIIVLLRRPTRMHAAVDGPYRDVAELQE